MTNELTKEEKEVLKALGMGFTYKEITEKFLISQDKIKQVRKSVMKKLAAANTVHAVYIAYSRGILKY